MGAFRGERTFVATIRNALRTVISSIRRDNPFSTTLSVLRRAGIISKERLSVFNCCVSPPFVSYFNRSAVSLFNAITHSIAPSVVAGLTCYTCVNVSDNQVSTSPLNVLLRVRNACIVPSPVHNFV